MKPNRPLPESASASAQFQLALSLISAGQLARARTTLEHCLALAPGMTAARLRLAAVCQSLGEIDVSDKHLRRVLKKEPRNTEALIRHANNRMVTGETEQALAGFRKALDIDATATVAAAGLASILIRKGDFEQAMSVIDPYLAWEDVHETIAIAFSDICHRANRCGEAIALLEKLVSRGKPGNESRAGVLFALCRLYDRAGEYGKAFEIASEANRLKPVHFRGDELRRLTAHYIETWSTDFSRRLPTVEARGKPVTPVFIVGMPRSGTTLVEQILASHPDVFGAGELKTVGETMLEIQHAIGNKAPFPDYLAHSTAELLEHAARRHLQRLAKLRGKQRGRLVSNKMPQNFWYLGFIHLLFPNALIIHCKRNPLDTCLSCYFTNFADGNEFASDLDDLAAYFEQYYRIMAHWREAGVPMLEMPYEDLVRSPEASSRKLVEYCGLEWDESCLTPHKTRRDVVTASSTQVRERIYTSSIDRWKHYEQQLSGLRRQLEERGIPLAQ